MIINSDRPSEVNGANGVHVNGSTPRVNGHSHIEEDITGKAIHGDGPSPTPEYEPIAIIGCAMRLPGGVQTAESFWDLLDGRREGRCRVPATRYNVEAFYGPGRPGHVCSEYGHFLQDVDLAEVDTSFWSMTRQEVEEMDPQQRLALEVVYECLQNSGTTKWRGKNIGTYFGIFGEVRDVT